MVTITYFVKFLGENFSALRFDNNSYHEISANFKFERLWNLKYNTL